MRQIPAIPELHAGASRQDVTNHCYSKRIYLAPGHLIINKAQGDLSRKATDINNDGKAK